MNLYRSRYCNTKWGEGVKDYKEDGSVMDIWFRVGYLGTQNERNRRLLKVCPYWRLAFVCGYVPKIDVHV